MKKCKITKDGVEYTVRAHQTKTNANLVSAGHMKRLVNSNKGCVLMVVRGKEAELVDAFEGCDQEHKKELCELISNYDEMFQELNGLPLNMEIQHEIHL